MCVCPRAALQTILGNWDRTMGAGPNMASPLCRKVGEGQLAHSLSTFNTTYKDTGLFGVYTVCEPTKVWELYANGECSSYQLPTYQQQQQQPRPGEQPGHKRTNAHAPARMRDANPSLTLRPAPPRPLLQ